MSSLNPIMRVGQQLTEAMILKAKTGKKNAKHAFNSKLKLLGESINAANAQLGDNSTAQVAEKLKKFDDFCVTATKIEGEFSEAHGNAVQLEVELENAILMLEKQRKYDVAAQAKRFAKIYDQAFNTYVVAKNDETVECGKKLAALAKEGKKASTETALAIFREMYDFIKEALGKEQPNFFTLAYYLTVKPGADLSAMTISEMNRMTREFLDENFMLDFIATAEKGVAYSHKNAIQKKAECLGELREALEYFKAGNVEAARANAYHRSLSAKVAAAVDRLGVKKESVEYVFDSALGTALKGYFDGIKNNPVEEKKYLKNKAKYDAIIAKGQEPDWVLTPQVVVDLELQLANVCKVIENLCNHYEKCIADEASFDVSAHVVEMIDFFKDQASKFVVAMNKRIAKAKAIKLLEEVGIPEPATRFNQYPFEFSGGMRQRIVIAIALSANPDILICDEPTTALDVTIQAQILELINQIKKQRNLSVIFITHNMGVVANMADRIAVMYAGKIVELGTAEEVFYEPAHPYTWALLSSMPDLETTERLESIPGTPPNMIYPPRGDAFAARNKYALEIDFELEPPLFEVSPTHHAATWLLHPNAPAVEMPALIKARIARMKKERE